MIADPPLFAAVASIGMFYVLGALALIVTVKREKNHV